MKQIVILDKETGKTFKASEAAWKSTYSTIKSKAGKTRYEIVTSEKKKSEAATAAQLIEQIKTMEEVPRLQELVEDSRKTVREAAEARIEELGNE